MQQDNISRSQLAAMIWAGVLAPVAELLPALTLPVAGRGAWLSPLIAIPLVLPCVRVLSSAAGQQGLALSVRTHFGTGVGTVVLLLYIVWAQGMLALRLHLCA